MVQLNPILPYFFAMVETQMMTSDDVVSHASFLISLELDVQGRKSEADCDPSEENDQSGEVKVVRVWVSRAQG